MPNSKRGQCWTPGLALDSWTLPARPTPLQRGDKVTLATYRKVRLRQSLGQVLRMPQRTGCRQLRPLRGLGCSDRRWAWRCLGWRERAVGARLRSRRGGASRELGCWQGLPAGHLGSGSPTEGQHRSSHPLPQASLPAGHQWCHSRAGFWPPKEQGPCISSTSKPSTGADSVDLRL